jgi:hypothetical protein
MIRSNVVLLGLLICCLGIGCASSQESARPESVGRSVVRAAPQRMEMSPVALFDRRPGLYDATEFAVRSDWPSAVSFYPAAQLMYSRERLVDVQGPHSEDFSHQRTHTERVTVGYR